MTNIENCGNTHHGSYSGIINLLKPSEGERTALPHTWEKAVLVSIHLDWLLLPSATDPLESIRNCKN